MTTKTELIKLIAERTDEPKKLVAEVLDATLETIIEDVAAGNSIHLRGFGSFSATRRAERNGRHPKTGEVMVIPAVVVPTFSAAEVFRDKVKGAR